MVKVLELKRMYESMGPVETCERLGQALTEGHLRPDDFSIRDLFVGLIEGGDELLRQISYGKSGGFRLQEAAQGVDTSAFSNITGQIIFNKVKEGYNSPEFLWPQLCETIPTTFLNGELIPGIGQVGDKAEVVGEGNEYPMLGLNEEYVQTPVLSKRGFIIPVTREIIVADRTGLLLRVCGEGGRVYMGVNKEKRVIDVATGQTNSYKRNGTATNTYLTSGAYINSQSNRLTDWTSVEKAELLFDAMTDPNTGEPIILLGRQLLVPTALKYTARRILEATEVAMVDNQANATTYRTMSGNPLKGNGSTYTVLSSPYVKVRDSSATTWFFGDFKRAFAYMEAWAIETLQASPNSESEFRRDIWQQYKVSEMGKEAVLEPREVTTNT